MSSSGDEETLLESLFSSIARFNFDRAKDTAEKESNVQHSSPTLSLLLIAISHFAVAEKAYQSLLFLQPKGFLRKENTFKANYETLKCDLGKAEETSKLTFGNGDTAVSQVCSQLVEFAGARIELMELYEKMYAAGTSGRPMNFEEFASVLTEIVKNNKDLFLHPTMATLAMSFQLECSILGELLSAQVEMQSWQFLASLMHLDEAHIRMGTWGTLLTQNREPPPPRPKLSFGASFFSSSPATSTAGQTSALYQWLWKLKGALLSKFSLYFYETLSGQTSSADMKATCTRLLVDYIHKIQTFQRKTDANVIALMFDATSVKDFKGHGYHHPWEQVEIPKGMESYPAVFSYPQKSFHMHWPNVVMIASERAGELTVPDRVVYFYDARVQTTYYLCRADLRFTVVVIFDSRKSERDTSISNFVTDICLQLRCNRIFASLKPGSK